MRPRLVALLVLLLAAIAPARAADPITIGFAEALTGGLAVVGKSGVLAAKIWADEVNARGGLLGRPVKLVFYDNQSNASNVPGIYTKLLDVDHVDLIISGYATNMTAPAMPVAMGHNKLFVSLFCLAVNSEFHYPRYFSMLPTGPDPKHAFSRGYFDLAVAQNPKPQTVAIVAADAEFARNASDGARDNAKAVGLRVVYDGTYPPTTTDYTPVVRATNPDVIYVASYPTALKTQLGPLLNGIVINENWLPAPTMQFPGVLDFLKRYQAKAAGEGVDPLGYFLPPWAYARMQLLAEAIEGTKSIDDGKLADYFRGNTFKTIIGDVTFGKDGEWAAPRIVWTQFQNIKGSDLKQFEDPATEVVVLPNELKSGTLIWPYSAGRQ